MEQINVRVFCEYDGFRGHWMFKILDEKNSLSEMRVIWALTHLFEITCKYTGNIDFEVEIHEANDMRFRVLSRLNSCYADEAWQDIAFMLKYHLHAKQG